MGGVRVINTSTITPDKIDAICKEIKEVVANGRILPTYIVYTDRYLGNCEAIYLGSNISLRHLAYGWSDDNIYFIDIILHPSTNDKEAYITFAQKAFCLGDIATIKDKLNQITEEYE